MSTGRMAVTFMKMAWEASKGNMPPKEEGIKFVDEYENNYAGVKYVPTT